MAKTESINLMTPNVSTIKITICGTSDLVLNKMNDVTVKELVDKRKDKAKSLEKANEWEKIITSMHWYNGKPTNFSEEGLKEALKNNAPCITTFGLSKSFASAVIDNNISKYSKSFRNTVNVIGKGNLVPISFVEHYVDEKLMSPQKGAPVLVHLNRFSGWRATFEISFMDNVYSVEQIVNIVNLAGFGQGIGSGRSSGYGRYQVIEVVG